MNPTRSVFLALILSTGFGAANERRPNIVLILADDLTWRDMGCYGNGEVRTPNIDRLAAQGMKFTHAFTATAMCSPTRQQLYTGLFPVRNGAYPNHSRVREGTKSLAHYLKPLGYRVALWGKSHVGPPESFPWEKVKDFASFIRRDAEQPYCLVFASPQPHLPWLKAKGFDPAKLTVPPYLVDTPETRQALANYYTDVADLDRQVGEVLKAAGAENTLVIFTSEQGAQFPFCKWTCYDLGLRTGFIARRPGRIEAGSVTDAMIQYVDVVPTLVEAAGGTVPEGLDGRSFLGVLEGRTKEHGDYAYGIHTTLGIIAGKPYPIRSIRSRTHRYILNLMPKGEFNNTVIQHDRAVYWRSWVRKAESDDFAAARVARYRKRPKEELYDLAKDPYELENLAGQPEHRALMDRMREKLEAWMKQQGDKGIETEMEALSRKNRRRR